MKKCGNGKLVFTNRGVLYRITHRLKYIVKSIDFNGKKQLLTVVYRYAIQYISCTLCSKDGTNRQMNSKS